MNGKTPWLLRFSGLEGGYGDTVVLRGVDGGVRAGQVLGVLGRNGVGKTTLMRLLTGGLRPFSGEVAWQGKALEQLAPFKRSRLGLAYSPQEGVVFDELSVSDNLLLHLESRDMSRYAPYLEAFPRLRERLRQRAGTLSGGEKKLLAFVRVLAEGKPLSLLDEPTEGVQQENIDLMAQFVRRRVEQGAAFIVVEQNLGFLQQIMDTLLVLDHGRCVAQGEAGEFDRARLAGFLHI